MTVEASSASGATVSYTASATDNVDPWPALACAPASGSVFPVGATTVNCTATDAAVNAANGSFTVRCRRQSTVAAAAAVAAVVAAAGRRERRRGSAAGGDGGAGAGGGR